MAKPTVLQAADLVNSSYIQYVNAVINGGFDIWQKGTSFTDFAIPDKYHADMWQSWRPTNGSGLTVTKQSSGLYDAPNCVRVQRASGNTSTLATRLAYIFESQDSVKFRNQKVTLSFYARKGANYSEASSNVTVHVKTGTGTDENMKNTFTGESDLLVATGTLTTSWQRFSFTTNIVPTSINQIGFMISNNAPVGTAGTNDYFEVTGVVFNAGDKELPYCPRTFNEELIACLRYFEKSYEIGVAPGTSGKEGYVAAQTPNNTVPQGMRLPSARFKATKRTNPSISFYSYLGTLNMISDGNGGNTIANSIQIASFTTDGFNCTVALGFTTINYSMLYHWVADARL